MWFALAVFTLVAYVDAISNTTQCPTGCNCQVSSSSLTVDCRRLPASHVKQLSGELDSILSSDHVVNHLTSLSITNTPLTHVPASVCKLVNLTSLNLNNHKVTELPNNCFTKLTKLVTLSVTGNAIAGLQDGLFDGLQSLVSLDLSYNRVAFIGLRVFSNSSDLTSLRSLSLWHNRLTSLEPWWYYRCILGNKTSRVTILLGHNLISNFTNKLRFKFRCGMKRPYGYLDIRYNQMRHIMDAFNGWNMVGNSLDTMMMCLTSIQALGIHFNFAGDTYDCDCTDFELYKMVWRFPNSPFLNDVRCGASNVYSTFGEAMNANSVPLIEFVCELKDHCPSTCRCVYRPANATLHVYCSSANLSSLPLDLPPLPKSSVKYKLDFSNNKLPHRLEHRPYFVNASILDVSNCGLTEITMEVLKDLSLFSVVNLRGNMFQAFPRQTNTVDISAKILIIGGNPWSCSCDNSWMIGWLQSLSDQILDPRDIVCRSPSRMYGRLVLKSTAEDFCVDPVKRYVVIIVSLTVTIATVITLVIAGLVLHKFRVNFYKKWKFHPFDRDECVGEDMDYDVFLCFSSEDENPHGLRILELLESKGYRVCYHIRDFRPGLILDNIIQSIQRSKRTVCLLSTNFLTR